MGMAAPDEKAWRRLPYGIIEGKRGEREWNLRNRERGEAESTAGQLRPLVAGFEAREATNTPREKERNCSKGKEVCLSLEDTRATGREKVPGFQHMVQGKNANLSTIWK